jgi:diguanylate cyclase (GGDEF)-like protein
VRDLWVGIKRWARKIVRPTSAPAAIAAAVILLFGLFADHQERQLVEARLRDDLFNQVNLIRAKLEGDVTGDIQLVRGLVAVVATEPYMSEARFAALGASLLESATQIKSIAGAPDLVISLMYPLKGNEAAIGLDYRKNAQQSAVVLRARDRNEIVLAGPVDLVQGGKGFIVRFPVFTKDAIGGRSFWGIVSAVIDENKLLQDAGLVGRDLGIDVAIIGNDSLGAQGEQFFGSPSVMTASPVAMEVNFPSGSWRIAAVPKGGWAAHRSSSWLLRLIILLCGVIVVIPTWLIGQLLQERRDHIARLRDREGELMRLSRRLELALETSKVGVWELDLSTGELVWDDRMNELYGYRPGEKRTYDHWRRRLHPLDFERAEMDFKSAIDAKGRYASQFRILLDDGRMRVIRTVGSVLLSPDSSAKILGLNWDVTSDVALNEALTRSKEQAEARSHDLEIARARIEHNALHDFLTKLPNRMYLDRILEERAALCSATGEGIVLLHIDLDRFKDINDTLGHSAGDAMLIHAAEAIRANLRNGDFVARTGGDEFVVVCAADADTESFGALARRIIDAVRKPIKYQGQECRFGMSIGLASARGSAVDRERLLVNADIALYRAKSLGRNRFEFYSEALQSEIVRRKQTFDEIMAGLDRGEFIPYFQPQFDARTLALAGVEALVRWRHPVRGLVGPDDFIPVAEEFNIVNIIDRVVLEQSLAQFRRWREIGLAVPHLSVNVALGRLREEGLVQSLRDMQIEPNTVSFELLESVYLDETDEQLSHVIEKIKALGIGIEIDDFGTGYASIVSLMKLKPRRLKIDRRLILPLTQSSSQRRLVRSIVEIGKALDIKIVAEGVETMAHAKILRQLKCDFLQGYAFAKPMAGEELARLLSKPQAAVETSAA